MNNVYSTTHFYPGNAGPDRLIHTYITECICPVDNTVRCLRMWDGPAIGLYHWKLSIKAPLNNNS